MQNIIYQSTITCPICGNNETLTMPIDSCLFFYDCPNCKSIIRAKEGDCCVFCSYGDIKCPPVQLESSCCGCSDKM
jgi:hypothetical protein